MPENRSRTSICTAPEPAPPRAADQLGPPIFGIGRGFTLTELLVALGIISVLLAIATNFYIGALERARVARAKTEIRVIEKRLAPRLLDDGTLPLTLDELDWRGDDPWGRPYVFVNFDEDTGEEDVPDDARLDKFLKPLNTHYDLYSMGRDGASDPHVNAETSWDDVLRASDGVFVGLASEF